MAVYSIDLWSVFKKLFTFFKACCSIEIMESRDQGFLTEGEGSELIDFFV